MNMPKPRDSVTVNGWVRQPGGGVDIWDGGCAASIPEEVSELLGVILARTPWLDGEIIIERKEDRDYVYLVHWYAFEGSSDTATVFRYYTSYSGISLD